MLNQSQRSTDGQRKLMLWELKLDILQVDSNSNAHQVTSGRLNSSVRVISTSLCVILTFLTTIGDCPGLVEIYCAISDVIFDLF